MKIIRYNYSKGLVFFYLLMLLILITGCNGGSPPVDELYGTIDVNSTPSGAKVYLDGEDTGQVTPIVLTNITVGDHVIELRKFHYKGWEDIVTVIAGQTVYLNPPLEWAPEESVTFQPDTIEGKDAYVRDDLPASNYGSSAYLVVTAGHGNPPSIRRSYLQFDLSDVPPNAVILSAKLGLYFVISYGVITSIPIGLYEVVESWGENTINWDNQPAISVEAVDIQNLSAGPTDVFIYWEIYELVKGWKEGSIANYGIVLRDTNESSYDGGAEFFSSDHLAAERPQLVINYYIP